MESHLFVRSGGRNQFHIDRWLVIPDRNQIERDGKTIRLEPRVMQVLLCLAGRPGEVISRETIIDTVWSGTVVCEDALTKAISELRQVLGDDTSSPHIIETIRKRGYRLIVPVRFDLDEERLRGGTSPRSQPAAKPFLAPRAWVGVATLAAIVAALWWTMKPVQQESPPDSVTATPFTSFPGIERYPAISADGTRIAFSWNGQNEDNFDIYVKQVKSVSLLRLTDHPAKETQPTWSPDESEIAFVRWERPRGIFICAALGGAERCLFRTESAITGIDWSPDGAWIACSLRDESDMPFHIVRISVQTLEVHPITNPEVGTMGDLWPAYSPDGERIAFTRQNEAYQGDVFVVPASGGEPRPLTAGRAVRGGLDWSPDGESVFFGAGPQNSPDLWSVSLKGGDSRLWPTKVPAAYPSVSQATGRLVFAGSTANRGIVMAEISGGESLSVKTRHAITSTCSEYDACFSPDGKKILFISDRSGNPEIWISNNDGENLRQLTEFGGADLFHPQWSPDGREIAFTATPDGYSSVFVMSEAGGAARSLSTGNRHELFNCWSGDGEWLYFTANSDSVPEIWKVGRQGKRIELVASPGCDAIGETADGMSLYYIHPAGLELWKTDFREGVESCEVDKIGCADWVAPAIAEEGIYFVRYQTPQKVLSFYHFTNKSVDSISPLPEFAYGGLSPSPDRKQFLYDRAKEVLCDLYLVENAGLSD